jgi:hypothetical protein
MSQNLSKKYNGFTFLGWFACVVILICLIYYAFLVSFIFERISFDTYIIVQDIVGYINGTAAILLIVSFINYIRHLEPPKHIVMYIFLGFLLIFRLVDMIVGVQWLDVNFLKGPVKSLPILVLVIFYWNHGIIPKILSPVIGLRIILLIILGVSSFNFLGKTTLYLKMFEIILIMVWLALGIPEKKLAIPPSAKEQYIPSPSLSSPSGNGIPPSTEWDHGVPRLLYWCNQCHKKIKMRPKNSKDIENKHECPKCGTILQAWWVKMTKETYFKFLICLVIAGSGFTSITYVNIFGGFGLYPLILTSVIAVIELLIGIGLGLMWGLINVKITGPPQYASETPSNAPNENFVIEVVIIVVIAFIGVMIGHLINMGIVSIFF